MIDRKNIDKLNRLALLLQELKSENFKEKYMCSYELAKKVYMDELDELEKQIKKEREDM